MMNGEDEERRQRAGLFGIDDEEQLRIVTAKAAAGGEWAFWAAGMMTEHGDWAGKTAAMGRRRWVLQTELSTRLVVSD